MARPTYMHEPTLVPTKFLQQSQETSRLQQVHDDLGKSVAAFSCLTVEAFEYLTMDEQTQALLQTHNVNSDAQANAVEKFQQMATTSPDTAQKMIHNNKAIKEIIMTLVEANRRRTISRH